MKSDVKGSLPIVMETRTIWTGASETAVVSAVIVRIAAMIGEEAVEMTDTTGVNMTKDVDPAHVIVTKGDARHREAGPALRLGLPTQVLTGLGPPPIAETVDATTEIVVATMKDVFPPSDKVVANSISS
jgi:hypothetical protein